MEARAMSVTKSWARAVVTAVALSVVTTGCGVGSVIVGVHDAPSEDAAAAPMTQSSAVQISRRVLTDVTKARSTKGKAGTTARKAAMSGAALASAEAAATLKGGPKPPAAPVTSVAEPTVLAVTKNRSWPRLILATTREGTIQYLHVLQSDAATAPYRLAYSVPMHARTSVPALGEVGVGIDLVQTGRGMAGPPKDLVSQYAAALATPKAAKAKDVAVDDPFAKALKANAAKQQDGLGSLAKLAQKHTPKNGQLVAFRLRDGGALVLAQLDRVDTVTLGAKAKELILPDEYATLVGEDKVTDKVTIASLETIAMVVPPRGKAKVIGVEEQLVKGSGD